ncbi:endo-1,4-beta-xylanase [Paenibacillus lentus]|uniref:Beta-xylanase n=1 Tax=Paenibacillus lentus TaxID=1338368 RepID=A0A3S8RU30_9BACL|nr:endo-1,4-beta-xylanase [Paenibacillus lentus]AZK46486.1 glycoside hydrolase [Paenibacillus lentus]
MMFAARRCISLAIVCVLLATLGLGLFPGGKTLDHVTAASANLLTNPGFESGSTTGWEGMAGTETLSVVSNPVIEGTYSALVEERQSEWHGIAQNLLGKLTAGQTYDISASVRLKNESSGRVMLTMQQSDGSGDDYLRVAESPVTDNAWSTLRGSFLFKPSGTVTSLKLYFEGPEAGVDFYVDDVVVMERAEIDWKAEANARIDQLRKGDVQILVTDTQGRPVSGANVEVQQTRQGFPFGSAMSSTVLSNSQYSDFFKNHFNWAVFENESKWYANETSKGNVNYSVADQMMEFAEANDITVRGHTVHWEVEEYQPSWVNNLQGDELRQAMDDRITSVVNHFKGKFVHWDVNNEMMHGSFFKDRLGQSIWPYMYQRTKELDPAAKLFVNDYNVISQPGDNDYKFHIQELLSQGAPIDGIGVQGHFGATIDPIVVKQRLDNLATLDLPIWISEYDSTQPNENIRADNLEALYRTAFGHPAVEGIMMWGFWAGNHWRGADAAIVNMDWSLNAAGQRYMELMDEWTTSESGTTSVNGQYAFRGFHGTYDVTVTKDDLRATKTFELVPGSGALSVPVQLNESGGEPEPAPTGELKVQYKAGDTNASDNQLKPHFNIVNSGNNAVPLSELTLRYYLNTDGNEAFIFNCDWAVVGCSNLSGKFVKLDEAKANADAYLEISFKASAGTLSAGGSIGEIQTRSHSSDWTSLNENNDYSFDSTITSFTDWEQVTLYQNGKLVWGVTP